MGNKDFRSETKQVEQTLDAALRAVIQDLPDIPTQLKCRRRRYFGVALMLTSPVCLVLAIVPAPFLTPVDHLMWFLGTNILLLLGGWQFDKAMKDEERMSRILRGEGDVPPSSTSRKTILRRAK